MSSRRNIGEASHLLAQPANNRASAGSARGPSNARASQQSAAATARGRSGSASYAGGPTVTAYSAKAGGAAVNTSRTTTSATNNNNNSRSSRGTTPVPNQRAPPQPTPRNSSQPRQQRGGVAASAAGLVNTPVPNSSRSSPPRGGPNYNSDTSDSTSFLNTRRQQQQQQQQHPAFVGTGADMQMFSKRMPELGEFETAEAKDALRQTLDTEKSLQGLVKARRDRALEVFEMLRDEGDEWQARLEATTRQLQSEEKKRLELAAQSRQIETEALNLRHKLRQVQNKRRNTALAAAGGGSNADDAPHTIIRSVLQKYNTIGEDDDSTSGDDEYAAVLDVNVSRIDEEENASAAAGGGGGAWFTNAGKKKKRKLSKPERLQAAGKIAEQLEQSTRVTRLSVESRVAELEATLGEVSSLQNQRIGFGATVEEMRTKVRAVQRTVQQATWLNSCMPLLEQTVRQREALAMQGEEYGRKVLDSLMQLNKRDDETIVVLQERAERNLLSTDQLIKMVQEENAHMSKELGEAVRDAETWRASIQQTSERYQQQLRETEQAIDEASKQRRASTF